MAHRPEGIAPHGNVDAEGAVLAAQGGHQRDGSAAGCEVQVGNAEPKDRLVVEDSQATVLAEHAAQDVAASRVQIEFLARSPDGAFLSYVVAEQRGSFAAPARGYLLPRGPPAQPPRLLAAPIYGAPAWSPSGDLYACTGRGAPSAPQPAIVRWRMDRP
jgi:hypothetical protein